MDKKQIIMVVGVAIVLLIGGSYLMKVLNKKSEKSTETIALALTPTQIKVLVDKLYLADHNGTVLISDDARRIFSISVEQIKGLSQSDSDSLAYVINQILSGKATDGDKNYLVDLSDTLSL